MPDNFSTSKPEHNTDAADQNPEFSPKKRMNWSEIWESLLRLGLGEVSMRLGTGLASIVLVLLVVWVMSNFYLKGPVNNLKQDALAVPKITLTAAAPLPFFDIPDISVYPQGITRLVELHTI
jgi:hypothetical protein